MKEDESCGKTERVEMDLRSGKASGWAHHSMRRLNLLAYTKHGHPFCIIYF
jgi:hypothetical protein